MTLAVIGADGRVEATTFEDARPRNQDDPSEPRCTFCGRTRAEGGGLLAGVTKALICHHCVRKGFALLRAVQP